MYLPTQVHMELPSLSQSQGRLAVAAEGSCRPLTQIRYHHTGSASVGGRAPHRVMHQALPARPGAPPTTFLRQAPPPPPCRLQLMVAQGAAPAAAAAAAESVTGCVQHQMQNGAAAGDAAL